MNDKSKGTPKIIVDDDWKAQAQAEKQRLEQELKASDKGKSADNPATGGMPENMAPLDFMGLINTLGMQAMMGMGGMEDPETKKRVVNLGLSKFNIDALALIREKTEGNLTDEEQKTLEKILYELQMAFVNISKQVAEMVKKQQTEASAAGGEVGEPPAEKSDDAPKIEQ